MHQLQVSVTILLFLFSTLFDSHNKSVEHKIYCPEDMYGQEYLKFYKMTAFLTTWTTTSPNESITIPTTGGGYLYDVAWGDGTTSVNRTGNATHTYASPGDYQISITGSFPRIYFNNSGDKLKIQSIDQWGVQPWVSMNAAFYGCQNLQELATDAPNLMNVSDMSEMFRNYQSLNQDINNWDVSNMLNMTSCFESCAFNQSLSNWNVSNVINFNDMFYRSDYNNNSITNWDLSNAQDMSGMFGDSDFNQDISSWNVSNVTNMGGLFSRTPFNQDISSWDVSNVTNMAVMFMLSDFNQDINSWDVSAVQNMANMFSNCSFNGIIINWDVSNVTIMHAMFYNNDSFDRNIANWDVSNVTDMSYMFNASIFNQNIGNWDVSNVTDMEAMFQDSDFDHEVGANIAGSNNGCL